MRICASPVFREPERVLIESRRTKLEQISERANIAALNCVNLQRMRLDKAAAKLDALNPSGVLERGYSYLSDGKNIISSAEALKPGMQVHIRMHDGSARAEVLETKISEK